MALAGKSGGQTVVLSSDKLFTHSFALRHRFILLVGDVLAPIEHRDDCVKRGCVYAFNALWRKSMGMPE